MNRGQARLLKCRNPTAAPPKKVFRKNSYDLELHWSIRREIDPPFGFWPRTRRFPSWREFSIQRFNYDETLWLS